MSVKKATSDNTNSLVEISVRQVGFIFDKFIPMLSNLSFVTKKYKDFLDWVFIVSLIYKGKESILPIKSLFLK